MMALVIIFLLTCSFIFNTELVVTINCIDNKHAALPGDHTKILDQLKRLYTELFWHDGYGELSLEMRFLKRGQKEIIIHCGKDYRYVVDYPGERALPSDDPPKAAARKGGDGTR